LLRRGALHAPNHTPHDGHAYRTIHDPQIQGKRQTRSLPCGPCGVIHDYVPFYIGYRSPMLFQLHTGRVAGYTEGQGPLIYVVSTAQGIAASGARYVFSDGHGLAGFTSWYDDLAQLDQVDWSMVNARYWFDTVDDPDRQRRKQAEFLVHRDCPWSCINELAVIDAGMKAAVESILQRFSLQMHRPVHIRPDWYY
jgi:ssDNA thymidine ADP-ribosyltransferase DarT-like protein